MTKDYYKILGVEKSATPDQIKKAYYNLAHQHHPDKQGDAEKFKEINEAYRVLSDKDKRAHYDQYGSVPQDGPQGFNWQQGQGMDFDFQNFDFGGFGDIFEEFFGGGGGAGRRGHKRGADIQVEIELTLEEAFAGVKKTFSLNRQTTCSKCSGSGAQPGTEIKKCATCQGSGYVQKMIRTPFGAISQKGVCPDCQGEGSRPQKPCSQCQGQGISTERKNIEINIPAGIDSNQVITVQGKGHAGKRNTPPGDLYARVLVRQHAVFQRRNHDLIANVFIPITKAALGGDVEIQTIEKKPLLLKIPAGTPNGKIFKISGRGMPVLNRNQRGDMYINIEIKIPSKLSRRQKELLEELAVEGL